ncbi:MAG: glycosyltransferase family 39 protein, partial [Oligoflexia bacterium]|nr:glycosyltransferase family 39 protein [Oligoflexia bacterium]
MLNFTFFKNNFSSHNTSHFLETKVFLFFIIFFCFAFQALSFFTLWTETELYPVHSSQYLFSQYANEFLFALKPLFYSILKLSFALSRLFDWLAMTGARFLFALNGLAILALFYFYVKNKTSRYNAILAVLFLASLNIFLDRAFRVRSDLLSTCFSLICLLVNLNIKEQKDDWKFYIIAFLLTAILLISPKGIYWLVFTSILLWHDMKRRPNT